MQEPQKVIVYRSKSEQMMDEFWLSDGWILPTKGADILCLFVLIVFSFWVYSFFTFRNFTKRWRH